MAGRERAFVMSVVLASCAAVAACGWDPTRPFERESPEVKEAIGYLDAGDAASTAASALESYLSTGPCAEGSIGAPERLQKRPDGTFDLGLALFRVGESYGRRFGEEEVDAGEVLRTKRREQVDCALRVVRAIASDPNVPIDLRARARYLEGNLSFLAGDYEEAVKAYDQALVLAPGMVDAGDPVGRDAAWNRAVALRRIEDKKDAGNDAAPPDASSNDGGQDSASPDAASPDGGKDSGSPEGGKDSGGGDDGGKDSGSDGSRGGQDSGGGQDGGAGEDAAPPPPPKPEEAGAPPPPKASQDDRILDQLENAPTEQQEAAKKQGRRRVRGMADK